MISDSSMKDENCSSSKSSFNEIVSIVETLWNMSEMQHDVFKNTITTF